MNTENHPPVVARQDQVESARSFAWCLMLAMALAIAAGVA